MYFYKTILHVLIILHKNIIRLKNNMEEKKEEEGRKRGAVVPKELYDLDKSE